MFENRLFSTQKIVYAYNKNEITCNSLILLVSKSIVGMS